METKIGISSTILVEKHELIDSWPGKQNAFRCVVLNPDNTKKEVEIPTMECELLMYMLTIQHKLNQTEVTKLKKSIESYGDEKYQEAVTDASFDEEL